MACCAFAVFLLMQLLAPFPWLRERVFGTRRSAVAVAAAWSPGAMSAAPSGAPRRRIPWVRGLAALAFLELALLMAGYPYLQRQAAAGDLSLAEALHLSWCGTGPLDIAFTGVP